MKKVVLFVFILSIILSCDLFEGNHESSLVSIKTEFSSSRGYLTGIKSIDVSVTAPDMNDINLKAEDNTLQLAVPKGIDRTFKVVVYYNEGRVYEGIKTVDISEDNEVVEILLFLVMIDPPSNAFAEVFTSYTEKSSNFINPITETVSIAVNGSGKFLYVLYEDAGYWGFDVFDITQPLTPTHLGTQFTSQSCSKIISYTVDSGLPSEKNYVYLAQNTGNGDSVFVGYDVTDPGVIVSLTITSHPVEIFGLPRDLFFNEDQSLVYMLTDDNTSVFNLADPSSPVFTGYIKGDIANADMELNGKSGFMYTETSNEFFVSGLGYLEKFVEGVVLSNPESFVVVANDGTDVAFDGRYAYVVGSNTSNSNEGFVIVDTFKSNSAERVVSTTPLFYSSSDVVEDLSHKGIALLNNVALIADNGDGLKAYYVYDKKNPVLIDSLGISGSANDVLVVGDYLYVASVSDARVYIIKHYL